ncbi:hypothetical protein F5Y13DRAFT_194210 [Hypoxylon sp. FL1857]|nr:hypothetical protein F5Y13DRAFT_194210 [Hypoxylon sp. FL1857]
MAIEKHVGADSKSTRIEPPVSLHPSPRIDTPKVLRDGRHVTPRLLVVLGYLPLQYYVHQLLAYLVVLRKLGEFIQSPLHIDSNAHSELDYFVLVEATNAGLVEATINPRS